MPKIFDFLKYNIGSCMIIVIIITMLIGIVSGMKIGIAIGSKNANLEASTR